MLKHGEIKDCTIVYALCAFTWFGKRKYGNLSLAAVCHWSLHRQFHMAAGSTVLTAS